jgi:hypothetical protein
MKKYYIVGKGNFDSVINDVSGNLNSYFELGWELMITYPSLKKLSSDGIFNNDIDFIVTANNDRKYLYTKSFNNVISWEEFLEIPSVQENQIIDLVEGSQKNSDYIINYEDFSSNLILFLKEFDLDVNLKNSLNDKKFVCLQYRNRQWQLNRNIDDSVFESLINVITNKYNLDVYIMGLSSEKFCDGVRVKYVNLQEFTTLINNENCILYYSTMSGPAHLSCYFANKNLIHIVNDLLGQRLLNNGLENHPLYQGNRYNFTNIDIRIIPYLIDIENFEKILVESIEKNS